ncbi:hypothetical protein RUA4292_01792 [Ruegeria atlantica]|uniref:Hedgehog/Intein (Hint) domain-containing protein n=1 Tax=Ruegeria atlantica TaxID=81569 RepID=A0A0P1ED23_9RHOB|nr:hypothetical protein RUA4292_01792 [Ruegeria atlantica]
MAIYSYIEYDPDVISVITAGPDRVILDTDFDPSTDRRVFNVEDAAGGNILSRPGEPTLPDTGTVFNGDYNSDENGDDLTQTGTVTNLKGSSTFLSGDIYLEESYILTDPDGGTITVFRVEVEGTLAGFITSEPLEPGTVYSMTIVNVTPYNAPDTSDPTSIVDVPCFTAGTLIETPDGMRPIEALAVGDEVVTMDRGPQRIRWIGARALTGQELSEKPKLRPIRIAAGCRSGTCWYLHSIACWCDQLLRSVCSKPAKSLWLHTRWSAFLEYPSRKARNRSNIITCSSNSMRSSLPKAPHPKVCLPAPRPLGLCRPRRGQKCWSCFPRWPQRVSSHHPPVRFLRKASRFGTWCNVISRTADR